MFIAYALRVFIGDKSLVVLSGLLLMLLSVAWFLGQTAVIETHDTSLVLVAEVTRLFCSLAPSLMMSTFLARLHTTQELHQWLARPVTRWHFILEALSSGIILSLVFITLAQVFMGTMLGSHDIEFAGALLLEGTTVLAVTLFFALNIEGSLKVHLLVVALYFLGRFKGLFLGSLTANWLDYSELSTLFLKLILTPLPSFYLFHSGIKGALDSLVSLALFLALTKLTFQKKCLS